MQKIFIFGDIFAIFVTFILGKEFYANSPLIKNLDFKNRNFENFHRGIRSMQKILFNIVALLLSISIVNAQEASPEIRMAAKAGLPHFLKHIPQGRESAYGFSKNDAIAQAYLGEPFNLYTIKPQAILGYTPGDSVQSVLSPMNIWYFPVMLKDEIRSILEVGQMDGKWQAVGFGYMPIANNLRGVMQRWPTSKGFHPRLIDVFQAQQLFIMVPEENANKLILLDESNPGLEMENVDTVMERLKPIVKEASREDAFATPPKKVLRRGYVPNESK
ncbi:MAG: hypothetical protein ACYDIC_05575 [Desulfobaccales bacterium]